jgi:hypothetical protein
MTSKLIIKAVAGAVALAMGSAAFANTTLNTGATTGDLFLNVVDYTVTSGVESSSSYLFDTGITLASFNPAVSQNIPLSGDANFAGVLTAPSCGGDPNCTAAAVDYSVLGATNVGGTAKSATNVVDFTSNFVPPTANQLKGNTSAAEGQISSFLSVANGVTNSSTTSTLLTNTKSWGTATNEGIVSNQLVNQGAPPFGDNAVPGTALDFYSETNGALTTFAGTWNLTTNAQGSFLVWNPTGTSTPPVPLPTPILLLLSGLGLMGLIARRGKSAGFVGALS